jgi:hypothetical protein
VDSSQKEIDPVQRAESARSDGLKKVVMQNRTALMPSIYFSWWRKGKGQHKQQK